ncbi:glycosyltransferase involved in cell wall biosynthesis [Luteimonas cucumeris]|uniref:Glycosyltransferase involved in cell wall biosynthesis n=1 Tax=Luteimonas cucumeris TaxID=985012 RepID=A0A562LER8_9GAMM|nr:glycosyltransferase family 2 protein [Luteimonas cucumeris]TWI06113.1 glycosyltransferase involved in cell wall biosynthesis [Luteimonas cucumeris]
MSEAAARVPLSAVVTTYNNAATLERCLASLAFCDEIVVLDSDSTDATRAIAQRFGARVDIEPFKGYGPQKQSAIDRAHHDWVLLLDADEHLSEAGRIAIEHELRAPRADGYRLPRQEWLFWRWSHPGTRGNWQLRLFRRSCGRMNEVPVHAAPEIEGRAIDLDAPFLHYGEPRLQDRVDKINRYSSGLVEYKRARRPALLGLRLLLYPPLAFAKLYFGKRYFLNGWAGYFAARTQAFYAFLKYAKLYEAGRKREDL